MVRAVPSQSVTAPSLELQQVCARRHELDGYWIVDWRVENKGAKSVGITSVRSPHGQFRSEEEQFKPAIALAPRGAAEFHTLVYCREPPGLVTENAFLIFNVNWLSEKWRVFVRLRIVVNPKGQPESATELVTTQKVGFSGMPN
jgi:hypothetical protein